MSDIENWSDAAPGNDENSPDGFPEGMPPSGVNDSAREVMAAIKRWYDTIGGKDIQAANAQNADNADLLEGNDSAYHLDRQNHNGVNDADTLQGSTLNEILFQQNSEISPLLRDFGDGSDGNLTVNGALGIDAGVYQYNDVTIPVGSSLNLNPTSEPLILRVNGTFTCEGIVNVDGRGGPPSSSDNYSGSTLGRVYTGGCGYGFSRIIVEPADFLFGESVIWSPYFTRYFSSVGFPFSSQRFNLGLEGHNGPSINGWTDGAGTNLEEIESDFLSNFNLSFRGGSGSYQSFITENAQSEAASGGGLLVIVARNFNFSGQMTARPDVSSGTASGTAPTTGGGGVVAVITSNDVDNTGSVDVSPPSSQYQGGEGRYIYRNLN